MHGHCVHRLSKEMSCKKSSIILLLCCLRTAVPLEVLRRQIDKKQAAAAGIWWSGLTGWRFGSGICG